MGPPISPLAFSRVSRSAAVRRARPVAEAAGARTQLTGVVGALAVALLLMLAPNLLQNLPNSALAAVVIAAAIGLFEIADLRASTASSAGNSGCRCFCFAGVATFGAIPGIGLAIVISVIEFLWDGWRPHFAVLGRVNGIRGYHDITRYPDARFVPGLVLFRWDAPLFFANAELFQECVREAVAASPTPVERIVVAAEPVTSVDVTSADMLAELEQCTARTRDRTALRRDEGSGEGQAQAFRGSGPARPQGFSPDRLGGR